MGWVLPTGRDELRVGCGGHIQYERTCVFICACECGTHVYSTRIGSGHGCILPTGRGVRPEFILRLVRHIFASVRAVQCSAWAVQAVQAVHLVCVCVCTVVGMCSPNVVPLAVSTCMRALYSIWHGGLGGVRSVHECYLHVCTVRVPLEQCLAWLARAMYLSCSCLYSYYACTRTVLVRVLCLYSYCDCTRTVLVPLHSVYCACTPCTVFWHGQHGQCAYLPALSSNCACNIAQCVLCLYLLYSGLAWPARAMYLFSPCLYSYGSRTIAQCVMCLYRLYSVLAWPARVMYLY